MTSGARAVSHTRATAGPTTAAHNARRPHRAPNAIASTPATRCTARIRSIIGRQACRGRSRPPRRSRAGRVRRSRVTSSFLTRRRARAGTRGFTVEVGSDECGGRACTDRRGDESGEERARPTHGEPAEQQERADADCRERGEQVEVRGPSRGRRISRGRPPSPGVRTPRGAGRRRRGRTTRPRTSPGRTT